MKPARGIDTGWPYLVSGVLVLACSVLVPAVEDLRAARWNRDRALAIETNRMDRLQRHERYLAALDDRNPGLVLSLAADQLGQIPRGHTLLMPVADRTDLSVFPSLEPGPPRVPVLARNGSLLERLTSNPRLRPWLLVLGVMLLFVGLLPPARPETGQVARRSAVRQRGLAGRFWRRATTMPRE